MYMHVLRSCAYSPVADMTSFASPGNENVKKTYDKEEENLAPSPDSFTITVSLDYCATWARKLHTKNIITMEG